MSDRFSYMSETTEALWACQSYEEICAKIADVAEALGFDGAVAACLGQGIRPGGALPPYWTNYNPEWVKVYLEQQHYNTDPIFEMATRTSCPFTWDEAFFGASPEVQKQRDAARRFGLGYGWAVPVHKPGKVVGLIGFASEARVELEELDQVIMMVVSQVAYEKIFTFFVHDMPDINLKLTDRERAILMLVARGKTNWEAGAVLSISEYSVRDHLKRLSTKLGTSNRTHTVARAMQLGLIVP